MALENMIESQCRQSIGKFGFLNFDPISIPSHFKFWVKRNNVEDINKFY